MKVSVLVFTYNHERFVRQALESVLMQETSFDWELIVLDDCSTDGTRAILLDIQRSHPERVRLALAERNMCDNAALAAAFETSPSQYIAWLDGDDYWTSAQKLQRQVDFLDAHPECALCYHNVQVHYEDPGRVTHTSNPDDQQIISTLDDLWAANFIAGCSPMFRRGLVPKLPRWYSNAIWGDWPMYLLFAQHGDVGYLPEVMGVYRVHKGGYWSGLSYPRRLETMLAFYRGVNANFNFRYNTIIQTMIGRWRAQLAMEHAGVPRSIPVVVAGDTGAPAMWGDREPWPWLTPDAGAPGGGHPASAAAAIARLEALRASGAAHLLLPNTAFWWLDHHAELRQYLDAEQRSLFRDEYCHIYALRP